MLRCILRGTVIGIAGGVLCWTSYAMSQPVVSPEEACDNLETFFPKVSDDLEALKASDDLTGVFHKICHREPILSSEEISAFTFCSAAKESRRLIRDAKYKKALEYANLVIIAGARSWLGYWLKATALSEDGKGIDEEGFEEALSEAIFWGWDVERHTDYPRPASPLPIEIIAESLLAESRRLAHSGQWGKIVDTFQTRDFGQEISEQLLGEIRYYVGWASFELKDYEYATASLDDARYFGFRPEHQSEYDANAQKYQEKIRRLPPPEPPALIPVLQVEDREVDNEDLPYEGKIGLFFSDWEYFPTELEEALPPRGHRYRRIEREKGFYPVRGRGIYRSELNIVEYRRRTLALGLLGIVTFGLLLGN